MSLSGSGFPNVPFDDVFPKGKAPSPMDLHPVGSIVCIDQCHESIWRSDPGPHWLAPAYQQEYEDPSKSMDLLLVRDRIDVPDRVDAHPDVPRILVKRLQSVIESKPVIWFPGLLAKAQNIRQHSEAVLRDTRSVNPALVAAQELGLKEIAVYRPVTPQEIKFLKSAGVVQRTSCGDVVSLSNDDEKADSLRWFAGLMPTQTLADDDPRFDFMRYRFSECFVNAVHDRAWNTVHAALDHWKSAGRLGLPLHPQPSRHASLDKVLTFIGMTAAGDDRVDVLVKVHEQLAPLGTKFEELLYQGVAKYGRKDPELDKTFASRSPDVRAWMSAQASLMAIKRVTAPHRVYPKVPLMGPKI